MERSGMEAPYDGAYVVYVKEAWSGGQQATIGYCSLPLERPASSLSLEDHSSIMEDPEPLATAC